MAHSAVIHALPCLKGSKEHIALLKMVLAAVFAGSSVDIVADAAVLPFIHIGEHRFYEANAAVRYFLQSSPAGEIVQNSVIEWEETFLRRKVLEGTASLSDILTDVDKHIHAISGAGDVEAHRPVGVILFATLYDVLSTATETVNNEFPEILTWFHHFQSHASIDSVFNLISSNINVKDASFIADASHRKMDSTNVISLEHDTIKLPKEGEENILITSALPYVNNVPHLGNIIGAVLSADVFSRFCRIRGINSLYICGTDEYGTATETKALEEGISCQELCTIYNKVHADVYKWFDIDFDYFGRTSTPQQTQISQDIFHKLNKAGYIHADVMTQLYCEKCHRFLADRYVEGTCPKCGYADARGDQCDQCGQLINANELIQPRCKLDGNTPILRDSKHLFLDLDKLQPQCESFVQESSQKGQWTQNGRLITNNWLKEGLHPRCITRDLRWGTPVPVSGFEEKVFYVWFDAPIGYISITANYTSEWEKWWKNPEHVKLYQFMGKDNVPFHTVIFPSSLIGTGESWTMLHHINTTEYLNYENTKFSKSRNTGVFGDAAAHVGIPSSVWRYYLLATRPETSDAAFTWRDLIARNNNELLANLGNFCNRVMKFIDSARYGSVIPKYTLDDDAESTLVNDINALLKAYVEELAQVKIRAALKTAMDISARGNQYLQDQRLDNNLYVNHRVRCNTVTAVAANLVHLIASVMYPFMPGTSQSIWKQLNSTPRRVTETWTMDLLPGHCVGRPEHLFNRIDPKMEETWKAKYGGGAIMEEKKAKKGGGAKALLASKTN